MAANQCLCPPSHRREKYSMRPTTPFHDHQASSTTKQVSRSTQCLHSQCVNKLAFMFKYTSFGLIMACFTNGFYLMSVPMSYIKKSEQATTIQVKQQQISNLLFCPLPYPALWIGLSYQIQGQVNLLSQHAWLHMQTLLEAVVLIYDQTA